MDDTTPERTSPFCRRAQELVAELGLGLLEELAAREDDVVAVLVELDDLALELGADVRREVTHATHLDQRGGQEAAQPDVEDETTLDDLDDRADDGLVVGVDALDRAPGALVLGALLGEDQATLVVLLVHHQRFDDVADLDDLVRVHVELDRQLARGDDALGLPADVEQDLVGVDLDDDALDDRALLHGLEGALEHRLEVGLGEVVLDDRVAGGGHLTARVLADDDRFGGGRLVGAGGWGAVAGVGGFGHRGQVSRSRMDGHGAAPGGTTTVERSLDGSPGRGDTPLRTGPRRARTRARGPPGGRRTRRGSQPPRAVSTQDGARRTRRGRRVRPLACHAHPTLGDHVSLPDGLDRGADGTVRCWWPGEDPGYLAYHDDEWGRPVHDDRRLFEKLCLEGFQAGLSWLTILRKRPAFREVFAGFDPEVVAAYGPAEVDELLARRRASSATAARSRRPS